MNQMLEIFARIILGGFFFMSGINHFVKINMMTALAKQKKLPQPKIMVALSGAGILIGGAGILIWILPQFAILGLVLFLILSAITMHSFWKLKNASPEVQMNELRFFIMNLALASALVLIFTLL